MDETKNIETMLEKLHFVEWDRFTNPTDNEYHVYGWIARRDSYRDFVVLSNVDGRWWHITSSAEYSKQISEIVDGTDEGHVDCQRVQHHFKIINSIKQ